MVRKCIIAIIFFCCALFCFCQLVEAQTYQVTEVQLQKLETELVNLKDQNSSLKKYNQNLNEQVKELERVSTDRQNTITSLTQSCSKLEVKLSNEAQEKALLLQENNKLKLKIKNEIIVIVILSGVIVAYSLAIVAYFFFKFRKV